jgi:hypothetical protein
VDPIIGGYSVLMEGLPDNVDNQVLQPYLEKWQDRHNDIVEECLQKYGDDPEYGLLTLAPMIPPAPPLSPAPSSAPTCTLPTPQLFNTLYMMQRGGQVERTNGIFFDIENTSDSDSDTVSEDKIVIMSLDIHLASSGTQIIHMYVNQGLWQEGNAVDDPNKWTQSSPSQGFQVEAKVKFNPTPLPLPVGTSPVGPDLSQLHRGTFWGCTLCKPPARTCMGCIMAKLVVMMMTRLCCWSVPLQY